VLPSEGVLVPEGDGEEGGRLAHHPLEGLVPFGAVRFRLRARAFFIDNLLVRNHFIIVMRRWPGVAPWEFEFPFPGSLTSTFPAHQPLEGLVPFGAVRLRLH